MFVILNLLGDSGRPLDQEYLSPYGEMDPEDSESGRKDDHLAADGLYDREYCDDQSIIDQMDRTDTG
mgnify:CR=1 FL=1